MNWEALKKIEKGERISALDGVPKGLPSLTMAVRIRASAFSVTWTPFPGAVFVVVCSATGVIFDPHPPTSGGQRLTANG